MNILTATHWSPPAPATQIFRVVLSPSHRPGEYVTHCQNQSDMSRYWGHYFDSFESAMADFLTRSKHYGLKVETNTANY